MSSSFMPFLPFRPCAHTTHFINSFIRAVIIIGGGGGGVLLLLLLLTVLLLLLLFLFLFFTSVLHIFRRENVDFCSTFRLARFAQIFTRSRIVDNTLLRFYCWSLWFLCIVFLATLLFLVVVVVVALYSAWVGTLMTEGVHFWHVIVITLLPIRHA